VAAAVASEIKLYSSLLNTLFNIIVLQNNQGIFEREKRKNYVVIF
jgi:hypothetical protein